MEQLSLHLAHYFFLVFHTALILFNLFGWLVRPWRRLHLFCLSLTLFSWFVLGIWKGFGYCFLTDWHYQVLYRLGETDLPRSYIAFLAERFTGHLPDAQLTEILTLTLTLAALGCSVWVHFSRR